MIEVKTLQPLTLKESPPSQPSSRPGAWPLSPGVLGVPGSPGAGLVAGVGRYPIASSLPPLCAKLS